MSGGNAPFVVFVALLLATALMRLGEVVVSVRRIRRRPGALVAEPWLFPAMATLHTLLVALPLVEVVALGRVFTPWLAGVAGLVLTAATALRVWTLRTSGRAWNVRVVVPEADGVVSSGPYRYIRHPNYLVVCLEIAALPLVHGAWASALALTIFNAVVLQHRIRTEERSLATLPAWRAAFEGKARLIPGVF